MGRLTGKGSVFASLPFLVAQASRLRSSLETVKRKNRRRDAGAMWKRMERAEEDNRFSDLPLGLKLI